MMGDNRKHIILNMKLKLILVIIIILTGTIGTGTSLARYVTGVSASSDTYVATFDAEINGSDKTDLCLNKNGKNSDSYYFTVTNGRNSRNAETKINYNVIVRLPDKLNNKVQMILTKNGEELKNCVVTDNGLTYTYVAGVFPVSQMEQHNYELAFKAHGGIAEDFSLTGIKLSVYLEQSEEGER